MMPTVEITVQPEFVRSTSSGLEELGGEVAGHDGRPGLGGRNRRVSRPCRDIEDTLARADVKGVHDRCAQIGNDVCGQFGIVPQRPHRSVFRF
jgi:hypothetical protein